MAISLVSAGGYCPEQYQLPGASHTRLAGLAIQRLDFFDTRSTLKMRTLPYLDVNTCVNRFGSTLTSGLYPNWVSL